METLNLLFKSKDVIVMDDDVRTFGFTDPCLVLEVQTSGWECRLREQIHIHLFVNIIEYSTISDFDWVSQRKFSQLDSNRLVHLI